MLNLTALKAVSVFALSVIPTEASFVGQFVADHEITLNGYQNHVACVTDEGRWINNACYFDVADSVFFEIDPQAGLVAEISTVGNNGDECNLDGEAEIVDETSAVVKSTLELPDHKTVTCELSVVAKSGDFDELSVTAKTPAECEAFCGHHASLNIRAARRLDGKGVKFVFLPGRAPN